MIAVRIPWVGQEVAGNSDKLHTVFRIEVLTNGRRHSVDRRYRDFHSLHKKLKKTMKLPDLPLKRGLWPRALEQRRHGLETYLQTLLCSSTSDCREILDFLNIKHAPPGKPPAGLSDLDGVGLQNYRFCRQVVAFTRDCFTHSPAAELPNVVVAGVLQALYPSFPHGDPETIL
ncbi:sorting nexin-24-like [Rhinoraja longicauda]